jgi:hypothetical protein
LSITRTRVKKGKIIMLRVGFEQYKNEYKEKELKKGKRKNIKKARIKSHLHLH